MIATWMFGATLFTLLLVIAAYASERALGISRRATRTPWAMALVLSVVWPAAAPIVLQQLKTPELAVTSVVAEPSSPATIVLSQLPQATATWGERLEPVLMWTWVALSVAMLLRLGTAVFALRRITRRSRRVKLDGEEVLITDSLGPAVVGLWQPRIAVPDWFLGLDAPLRKLVLQHELEHCRSRDPQLVWLASLALAVMPWNVGIWMLARRLRLALEIDCDARTLGHEATSGTNDGSNSERYGKLLLLIAQRQSSYPLVSMLAESNSHLRQRITAMQMKPLPRRAVRIALCAGVAATAVAVACSPRVASDLTGPNAKPQSVLAAKSEAEKMSGGSVYFESQVETPVGKAPGSTGPQYPAELRAAGVEGRVLAMFVVNTDGTADTATLKVQNSSHPLFTTAVREALPNMRFTPAEIGGRKVRQLVQQPMSFNLSRNSSAIAAKSTDTPLLKPVRTGDQLLILPEHRTVATAPETGTATVKTKPAPPVDVAPGKNGVYFESQVEVAVVALGSKMPVYPEMLKTSGVEGRVLVQFVVNGDGTIDEGSVKVLKSDHQLFQDAVTHAIPEMRFKGAQIGGRPVRQLVQYPFIFSLSR